MSYLKKYSDIAKKNGVFKGDHQLWDWFKQTQANTAQRVTVTISLLDEGGAPTVVWTLANAWSKKVFGTDLKATGNEVAMETLVVSHEGFSLANS